MNNEKTQQSEKPDKKKMQTTQQIFHILLELTELFPQYTICQHLSGILRKKNPNVTEFYHWSNEQLHKRIEKYKRELEDNSLDEETTTD